MCDTTLASICIDRHFVVIIFDVGECCDWICISIDIVIPFLGKEGLIIIMVEHRSLGYEPAVRISIKDLAISDWRSHH